MKTMLVEFIKESWTRNVIVKDENGNKMKEQLGMDHPTFVKTFNQFVNQYNIQLNDTVIDTAYEYDELLRRRELSLKKYLYGEE